MSGEGWRLTEQELRAWLDSLLASSKQVVVPSVEDGLAVYRSVSSGSEVTLSGFVNTRWSPKEYLFPRDEVLFTFEFKGNDVQLFDGIPDRQDLVLFNVRPCDAAGLTRLDDIFLGDEEDPFYARRRATTTVVSLACKTSRPECFCTAVGGSPGGTEGSDLQLISIADYWLLSVVTPKGRALVDESAASWTAASDHDWIEAENQKISVEAEMARTPVSVEWAETLENTFEHPLWDTIGERCLGCGICAYVCPSCSCFDVSDEGNAFCGTRCRLWDTCTFTRFTVHTSGHNPRPTQTSRYRQRILHKFSYFPLEHDGQIMCVGCGRCVALCPVGIDIHASVNSAVAAAAPVEGD